ncbi:MAG TPA: NAD(P)/FAD-dependent oxidoreductase [Pyrinomonadaceae bacterium]|nr:NAD(P)/FAD-dependent oxidoreductase [Pyrinomonadaceae bacterium]
MKFDAIIIGGGAAGLFCAAEAGKRGHKVLVVEHNAQVGRKILISGGGRCNFTNVGTKAENFISKNPHFCKSALARYTPQDFIELVKKHKIEFYEKKLGQLFCKDSSRRIVEMLLNECRNGKVEIRTNCSVKNVAKKEFFEIETNQGNFSGKSLVIGTGGLSFPKIGATDFGFKIARQFGLKIVETRPSLVPLVFEKIEQSFKKLAGISVDTIVSCGKTSFRENILFTHRGLSGPAILQISNYWQKEKAVSFDLLPDSDAFELLEKNLESKQNLDNFLAKFLPNRFAEVFTQENFPNQPLNRLNRKQIEKIADNLNNWQVKFSETEGFHKAEVTLGGVDTNELSSQTMESKKVKNLYFIGEVIDVTGWLGGYNFQWAWSSAFAASQNI